MPVMATLKSVLKSFPTFWKPTMVASSLKAGPEKELSVAPLKVTGHVFKALQKQSASITILRT